MAIKFEENNNKNKLYLHKFIQSFMSHADTNVKNNKHALHFVWSKLSKDWHTPNDYYYNLSFTKQQKNRSYSYVYILAINKCQ